MKETRTFSAHGKSYVYTFERKKIKNLNLRIKSDGSLHVSAPQRMALSRIESFLAAQTEAIDRARERMAKKRSAAPKPLSLVTGDVLPIWGVPHTVCVLTGNKRMAYVQNSTLYLAVKDPQSEAERMKCFTEFLAREAASGLTARTELMLPLFAPKPAGLPQLTFRTMTSKWGVCRPTAGRITFNRNLAYLPLFLVDYVICHELAHFHHADHSTAFWNCLAAVMPDCKERRKALNAFPLPLLQTQEKT